MERQLMDGLFDLTDQILCVASGGVMTAVNRAGQQAGLEAGTPVEQFLDLPIPEPSEAEPAEFRAPCLGRMYRIRVCRQQEALLLALSPDADRQEAPNTLIRTAGSIRTSLQDLSLALDKLSDRLDLDRTEDGHPASLAMRSLFRLQRIAAQLDLYYRLSQGDYIPVRRTAGVISLLSQTADTAEDLLYRVGIPVVRSLPRSELPGWVDWDLVELMLWELLGNAAAHSGDRPIRLSAKSSGPDRLLISIENSSPTDLPEDLYRQHSLPPETASGTLGLGLSVVRMGAAAHGGSLLLSQGPGGSIRALLSLTLAREPDKPRLNSFPVDRSAFPTPLVFLSSVLPAEDYDLRDLL